MLGGVRTAPRTGVRSWPPATRPAPWGVWRRVMVLAALVIGLVLMHGLGLGHGSSGLTHVASAPKAAHATQQPAPSPHESPAHPRSPSGDDRDDSGHHDWAQMCVAVLTVVALAALAVQRFRGDRRRRARRPQHHGIPALARTSRPRDQPDLHQLCVMRT